MLKKLTVVFGACLCLWSNAYSLTLGEAETELRRLIKDTATSATLQRYSDTVLDSFLNQSQRDIVNATWCIGISTSVTLSAGTTYYSLPSDLIAVKMVRFVDSTRRTRKLSQVSYKALFETNPDFERQTGPPMNYIVRDSTSSDSSTQIAFLPIPTTSSTGTATVDYYKQSTDMNSDSDILLDGNYNLVPYHETVVFGAVVKLKIIEGDLTGAAAYSQLLQSSLQAMKSRLGENPDYNPGLSAATPGSSPNR